MPRRNCVQISNRACGPQEVSYAVVEARTMRVMQVLRQDVAPLACLPCEVANLDCLLLTPFKIRDIRRRLSLHSADV